mmetsp:Transcript_72754/g.137559  ORF Transcript_72754/g.137559 Transcript_72754/m.137559 type:complete len:1495 (-) Transcript_72754:183-4667(-)
MASGKEYYDILGVDDDASTSEIRTAYRKLALTAHPDRGGDADVFAKIAKAYEVLSDPKMRERYDTTGRTAALSPEEEFLMAFKSGGTSGSKYDDKRRGGQSEDARREAQRKQQEEQEKRAEAQRKLDEMERRDAERRRRAEGGAPSSGAPSSYSPAPSASTSSLDLGPGTRVVLGNLKSVPELNGVFGTIVEQKGDRWQVKLDNGQGEKLLKVNNLTPVKTNMTPVRENGYPQRAAEPPSRAAEPPSRSAARMSGDNSMPRHCIIASWKGWQPSDMMWDPTRSCFFIDVELTQRPVESFQIWVNGDSNQCLHPNCSDASPHNPHKIQGPDARGHGLNWTIGRHTRDQATPGSRYEIIYNVNYDGSPKEVTWTRTGGPAAAAQRPSAARLPANLSNFFGSACPAWSEKDKTSVIERLTKIKISRVSELISALRAKGGDALNPRLRAANEKSFTQDTLTALRKYADTLDVMVDKARNGTDGGSQASADLPRQTFKVVHDVVYIRDRPSRVGASIGSKTRGERVTAMEETFDGWVKLEGNQGWILRDMQGREGIGQLLTPEGRQPQLAVSELVNKPGPQKFTVCFKPRVAMRDGPSKDATVQGLKKFGEQIQAETQTYHGWVRLANGAGWMLAQDNDLGKLLEPTFLDEQRKSGADAQAAQSKLSEMMDQNDAEGLKMAIVRARAAGVDDQKIKAAEVKVLELKQRDDKRRNMKSRINAAAKSESELAELVSECYENGWNAEASMAQELLDVLFDEQMREAEQHERLLDQLKQATISGDPTQIKAARQACKTQGISMKEISRVFSLAQVEAQQSEEKAAEASAAREQYFAKAKSKARGGVPEEDAFLSAASQEAANPTEPKPPVQEPSSPTLPSPDPPPPSPAQAPPAAAQPKADATADASGPLAEVTEALKAAARSNDPVQIKNARNAAKSAGMTTKEIGRIFALAQNEAQEPSQPAKAEPPMPEPSPPSPAAPPVAVEPQSKAEQTAAPEGNSVAEVEENLKAAARSNDPVQIKAARNAAKAAGMPTKEIGRIFALAQNEAQEPAKPKEPEPPAPAPEPQEPEPPAPAPAAPSPPDASPQEPVQSSPATPDPQAKAEEKFAVGDSAADVTEQLKAAARSNDPVQVKAARNAAKAAGMTTKEIGRIFALAQNETPEPSQPREPEPSPPEPLSPTAPAPDVSAQEPAPAPAPAPAAPVSAEAQPKAEETAAAADADPVVDVTEQLKAAARSNDPSQIKAARNAAKAAGMPTKEIGRIFALAQNEAQEPSQPREPEPPMPTPPAADVPAEEPAPVAVEPQVKAEATPVEDNSGGQPADITQQLKAAARSGDAVQIKAARNAAKAAGMTTKEIGRIFALAQNDDDDAGVPSPAVAEVTPPAPTEPVAEPHAVEVPAEPAMEEEPPPEPEARAETEEVQGMSELLGSGLIDGDWVNLEGEYMGTIMGAKIQWADGPELDLGKTPEGGICCEMFEQVFSAILDEQGRLVWSDGDIWVSGGE